MSRQIVFVLVRFYPGEPGYTVERVYTHAARAEEDRLLAAETSHQQWAVHAVPLFFDKGENDDREAPEPDRP